MDYRARIELWRFVRNVIIGRIYDDKRERFGNGAKFSTSVLLSPTEDLKEGAVIESKTGKYLLGKKG